MLPNWRYWALILSFILSPSALLPAQSDDILDLESGAVVLSATTQYGGRWSAPSLLDGSYSTGWGSAAGQPYPNSIVIELARQYRLTAFAIDNRGAEESSFHGISARRFELYGSTTSPNEGFYLLLDGKVPKGKRRLFGINRPAEARWLKLVVLSNWGNPSHTEIMELEAYGDPTGEVPDREPVQGVYDTNYGLVWLEQIGGQVQGCYDWDHGRLFGSTDGRVLQFGWWEDGPFTGAAVMVLSSDGHSLNGVYSRKGQTKGIWYGNRVTDGRRPKCQMLRKKTSEKPMEKTGHSKPLAEAIPVVSYLVYFDSDSAVLKPESTAALEKNLAELQKRQPQRILIEGHADSTNTDEYNMELSQRRVQAVMDWLTARGLDASLLEARGFGEFRPVADNVTVGGRALNRRVEIAVR
jgi:outer membrane protein OmpA-like peptidoglycan-associated protein